MTGPWAVSYGMCYRMGREAARRGVQLEECPFRRLLNRAWWRRGWWDLSKARERARWGAEVIEPEGEDAGRCSKCVTDPDGTVWAVEVFVRPSLRPGGPAGC
jgi:hypothetical protein